MQLEIRIWDFNERWQAAQLCPGPFCPSVTLCIYFNGIQCDIVIEKGYTMATHLCSRFPLLIHAVLLVTPVRLLISKDGHGERALT